MRSRSCCLCGESTIDDATVRIGDEIAHGFCADATDVYDVLCCPYCRRYEMIDDAADWTPTSDGRACPDCAKDLEPETAESIIAASGAAMAGRRNPLIDTLAGILREVTS